MNTTAIFKNGVWLARHSYSSTQIDMPPELAAPVLALAHKIDDADLAEDGRETAPHVTVKYGLHTQNPESVAAVLRGEQSLRFKLGKVSLFEADGSRDSDVVKIEIDSPDLHRLNAKLSDSLQHTTTHSGYKPHVTLAYVKPGRGKKYLNLNDLQGREGYADRVRFSDQDGLVTDIPLINTIAASRMGSLSRFDIQSGLWLRREDDDDGWRTINGAHVHIGKDGKIDRGPAALRGKDHDGSGEKPTKRYVHAEHSDGTHGVFDRQKGKAEPLESYMSADYAKERADKKSEEHSPEQANAYIADAFHKEVKDWHSAVDEHSERLQSSYKPGMSKEDVAAMVEKHADAIKHEGVKEKVSRRSESIARSLHKTGKVDLSPERDVDHERVAKEVIRDHRDKYDIAENKKAGDFLHKNARDLVERLANPQRAIMGAVFNTHLDKGHEGAQAAAKTEMAANPKRVERAAKLLQSNLKMTPKEAWKQAGESSQKLSRAAFVGGAWVLCRGDCDCEDAYEPDYAELPDDGFDAVVQLARDCGAGPGGFQKGNTCARGRYGSSDGIHTSRTTLRNINAAGAVKTREYLDNKARRIHEYRTTDGRLFHKVDDGKANGNRFYQVHGKSTPKKPITTHTVEGAEPDAPMMPQVEPDKVREHSARDHEKRVLNAPKRVDPNAERNAREDAERLERARIAGEKQKAAEAKEKADIESRPDPKTMPLSLIEAELRSLQPYPKAYINKQPHHAKRREALANEKHSREVSMRQQKANKKPDAAATVAKYWDSRRKLESQYLSRFDVASGQWVRELKASEAPIQLSLGYVTPISQTSIALSGLKATENNLPVHYFWKRVIADHQNYQHPQTGKKFAVSPERIKGWAKQVKDWVAKDREIPTPVDHSWSARDNLGRVIDAKTEEDGGRVYLSLLHRVVGDEARRIAESNWASVWIEPNYTNEFGENLGDCITHSAFVTNPVVSGMGPFLPAA